MHNATMEAVPTEGVRILKTQCKERKEHKDLRANLEK